MRVDELVLLSMGELKAEQERLEKRIDQIYGEPGFSHAEYRELFRDMVDVMHEISSRFERCVVAQWPRV